MEGICDYTFEPWRVVDGKVIRGDDWGSPLKWNLKTPCGCECHRPPQSWVSCDNCRDHHRRRRVFCCPDVFEDWQGPIVDHRGFELSINAGQGADGSIYTFADGHPEDDWGCRELTMDDLRADLFRLIDATPNLDWLLLTKRPENVRRMIEHGGESGRNARPCNVDWIRSLVNQCREAGVPAFTKQLGARVVDYGTLDDWPDATFVASTKDTDSPVEVVLKHSKGGTMDEWPLNIRVREFPCLEKSGAPS